MDQLYKTWIGMKHRCHGKGNTDKVYRWYRDKGIIVCDEWRKDFSVFREWALSHGFEEGLTIDRIDSDGNYCPDNCRWVTRSENSRNKKSKDDEASAKFKRFKRGIEQEKGRQLSPDECRSLRNFLNAFDKLPAAGQLLVFGYAQGIVAMSERKQKGGEQDDGSRQSQD